jgi:DNA mismatch repair ATPase MutS
MDEIFSSTNPNEGVSGAYAIADKLSQFKNNVCLITSHYSHLTNLEKEGKFKNYKIPISRDKQNNIIYNYKLMHGISNQYIALELLERKGFDKDIVRKAQQISRELCDNMENVRPKRKLKKKKKPIVKKNEEIHESTGKESTPREEPKETHNGKELLQVRELPKTEEVSK